MQPPFVEAKRRVHVADVDECRLLAIAQGAHASGRTFSSYLQGFCTYLASPSRHMRDVAQYYLLRVTDASLTTEI